MKGNKHGWTRVWLMTIVVCCVLGFAVGLLEIHPMSIEIDDCPGFLPNEKAQFTQRVRLFGLFPLDVRQYAVTEEGEKLFAQRMRDITNHD